MKAETCKQCGKLWQYRVEHIRAYGGYCSPDCVLARHAKLEAENDALWLWRMNVRKAMRDESGLLWRTTLPSWWSRSVTPRPEPDDEM